MVTAQVSPKPTATSAPIDEPTQAATLTSHPVATVILVAESVTLRSRLTWSALQLSFSARASSLATVRLFS